jgi:hypothetical protein
MPGKKRVDATDESTTCKIFELGSHLNDHAPVKPARYRLSTAQSEFLEGAYCSDVRVKPVNLFNQLEAAGLAGDCKKDFIKGWLKRRRKKDDFSTRDRSPLVQQIENWLAEMKKSATDFEGSDQHRLCYVPFLNIKNTCGLVMKQRAKAPK